MVQKGEIEYNDTDNFEVEAILDMAIQADEVITTYFSLSLLSTGHRSLLSNVPALLCGRFSVSCFALWNRFTGVSVLRFPFKLAKVKNFRI